MADSEREAQLAQNAALRGEIDELLAVFEQQRRELADAQARLASATVTAWSSDSLIRVTSNSAGVPTEVHVEPEAFKRSTPEKLGRSITEATQAAARLASAEAQRAFGSVEQLGLDIPDLPDLVPGAPSIKDLMHSMFPEPAAAQPDPVPLDEESEDEYYRNRTYLDGR
ncbi:YbaB/EbfC family nucleoid-associated protein [Nocardia sp. NPDC050710]|uniref:YbaB/EbfC family nucleoid-associated protein n=1 Tax=Nocardia sp. NPDC050710 TaxID=3157220 RepID=UPI003402C59B